MKKILITGSSSGFGKLAVPLLLKRGHTVLAALRGGEERLQALFANELKKYPGRLVALDIHMERPETFELAARMIDSHFGGRLDVLINNAGYGLFGALEDQTPEQLRHQMEVNFFGPVLLTRKLLPALRVSRGRVINLSSVAGQFVFPLYGSYSASKFALEALSEGLHFELKPHRVQVALIEPGGFRTDFSTRSKQFGESSMSPTSPYRSWSKALDQFLKVASARLGDPNRVAKLIVRLSEKPKLKVHNRIGMDARLMGLVGWILPPSWRVAILGWIFRKVVFKD